jgi:outer membrane protein assembly factor BamB
LNEPDEALVLRHDHPMATPNGRRVTPRPSRRATPRPSRQAWLALVAAVLLAVAGCEGLPVTPSGPAASAAPGATPAPTAATTTASVPPAGGSPIEWTTYLGTVSRTSASPDTVLSAGTVANLVPRLQMKLGGLIAAQAMVTGGIAYLGAWDGYEYAIDLSLGVVKWKTFLGTTTTKACDPNTLGVTSSATVDGGLVYVGGGDAYWYALDALTGAVEWKVKLGDNSPQGGLYNWSSPLVWHGSAYIGVASNCDKPLVRGELLRVDLATHAVAARFEAVPGGQTGGGIWQAPAINAATGTVFVTTGNYSKPATQPLAQSLVALDAVTLAVRSSWQTPPTQSIHDGDWGTTPVLFTDAGGRQLVGAANKNGTFYAFAQDDLAAGPVWLQRIAIGGLCPDCGDGTVSTPAFAGGRLFVAGGKTVVAGQTRIGAVRALDPGNGAVLWERAFDHAVIPALTWVNGMVVGGIGPDLIVMSADDGSELFTTHTGPETYGAPSVAEGMVFIGSLDGTFWAFGLPSAP